jgi:hypothetical protein
MPAAFLDGSYVVLLSLDTVTLNLNQEAQHQRRDRFLFVAEVQFAFRLFDHRCCLAPRSCGNEIKPEMTRHRTQVRPAISMTS